METLQHLLETDSASRSIVSGLLGAGLGSAFAFLKVRAGKSAAAAEAVAAAAAKTAQEETKTLATKLVEALSNAGNVAFSLSVDSAAATGAFEAQESLAFATKALWSALAFFLTVSVVFLFLAAVSRKRRLEILLQRNERERKVREIKRQERSWSRRALRFLTPSSWRDGKGSTLVGSSTSVGHH